MTLYRRGRPNRYNVIKMDGVRPPKVVGEYRIRYKRLKRIKYIGITNDLERRMNEHEKKGRINDNAPYFEWMPALPDTPYKRLREHEKASISKHNPKINKNSGGGGKEPQTLNYMDPTFFQRIAGTEIVEFQDKNGNTQFGVSNDKYNLIMIRFAISRFIHFTFKLVLFLIVLAILLNYFGIISLSNIIMKFPSSVPLSFLSKAISYLPKK